MMTSEIEQLGAPKTETLSRPPLEHVVCQIRHEPRAEAQNPANVLAMQAALGAGFDKIEPVNSQEFMIGPSAGGQIVPQFNQTVGWRLLSADGGWIATFNADSFALECTKYTTWSDFRAVLRRLINVVSENYSPQLVQRVGVRYVDRIWREGSTIPTEWDGWLNPGVLGLGVDPLLREFVTVAQSNYEMTFGQYQANLRGSVASDQTPNRYSFLLDIDCFQERSARFGIESLAADIENLHSLSLRLFQSTLTEKFYAELLG